MGRYTPSLGRRTIKSHGQGMDKGKKRDTIPEPVTQPVTGISWNNTCKVPGVSGHVSSAQLSLAAVITVIMDHSSSFYMELAVRGVTCH